jgi:hypothetical protein
VETYTAAAKKAIEELVAKRYMLREDVDAYVQRMARLWQRMTEGSRTNQQTTR